MLASSVHVLPLTIIRRERLLPVRGRVLVRQGQKVAPRDVIAQSALAPEHLLLDVARALGVSSSKVPDLIQRKAGDKVSEGDLIAGPVGITRRVLRAPVSGKIELIQDGKVLLEIQTAPYKLRAGLAGNIADLVSDRGAIIEATGALVQGVWGNGRMDFGLFQSKLEAPDGRVTPDQIDVSLRGAVILGGYCNHRKVLQNAADAPLKGLILSSMAATLVPLAEEIPVPVVVLQGFGKRPVDHDSFKLLNTNQNRDVSVNAAAFDRYAGTRPEVFIPLPTSSDPPEPQTGLDFERGQQVRLFRAPYPTEIGEIERIFPQPVLLPSGNKATAAQIRLKNGETATVPLANLEVLS